MAKFTLAKITAKRIRKQIVSVELMGFFFEKMAEQHQDGLGKADPEFASFAAFNKFTGRSPGKKAKELSLEDHLTMMAVTKRAFALVKLSTEGALSHWEQQKSDHVMMHPALVAAAAVTELGGAEETFEFNAADFLNNALAAAAVNAPFVRK